MKNIKFLVSIIALCFIMLTTFAGPYNATAKTKRIPAGTVFQLEFLQPVSTFSGNSGDSFVATLLNEQISGSSVILPTGTVVRGSILDIKTAKYFSRGAKLYLDFDHVVTPNGRQLPLTLNVVGRTDMTFDGGITTTKGYTDAWKQTCSKSGQITKDAISWAEDVTDSGWKYVLVPVSAFGGAFGTAGYFVYGSIADMIKKGKHVQINKDEVLNVILVDPIDVPVI